MREQAGLNRQRISFPAALGLVLLLWLAYTLVQTLSVTGDLRTEPAYLLGFLPGGLSVGGLFLSACSGAIPASPTLPPGPFVSTVAGLQPETALENSDLELVELQLNNHTLAVRLEGELSLGGVCDHPRFEAKFHQILLQFPKLNATEVYINGVPLEQVLSGMGEG